MRHCRICLLSILFICSSLEGANKTYYLLGIAKNSPIYRSSQNFESTTPLPSLGLRYIASDQWLFDTNLSYKGFEPLQTANPPESPTFIALSQSIRYQYLIYYPFYAEAGWQALYLYPVKKAFLSSKRSYTYSTDLGIGILFGVSYYYSNYVLNFTIKRWRTLSTSKIHSLEVALSLGWNFQTAS